MRASLLCLALVALLPALTFAAEGYAWQGVAMLAVLASFTVLIMLYLLTYLADVPQMRPMVTGEMFQVFITLVMIALFVGAEGFMGEVISPSVSEGFGGGTGSHVAFAKNITQSVIDWQWGMMKTLDDRTVAPLGSLSTLSGNCAFIGFGFTYNGCGGISVPFASMNLALRTMATALMALYAQIMLLNMADNFFFPILLPIGLFLRSFHVTRGTGGLLMAVAVAFYFIYPIGVIAAKGMFDMALLAEPSLGGDIVTPYFQAPDPWNDVASWDVPGDCNPFDMKFDYTQSAITRALDPVLIEKLLYHFFVGGILNTALALLIALASVRALSRIFGTEVDVSALARVA